ncbi:putative short chain dehydrogenase [Diaporthe ampelina]|uniref:Putative short chain dehydrogenase n=1 Tax=Diaporthe ampelina TaxID=1214573 RepID=A0A0G2HXW1_9PEZI|nr:putative short chain dehydrogenase [Diaporthe ampelina]
MDGWRLPSLSRGDSLVAVLCSWVGVLSLLSVLYSVASFVSPFVRPSRLGRYLHDTDGKPPWALVTGASDGIGKQFCHQLAARGFNVVLHGRNPSKLARVRHELARAFPQRQFRQLIADGSAIACNGCRQASAASAASATTPTTTTEDKGHVNVDFDAVAASLADINLTVLVNNAGGGVANPVYQFLQHCPDARLVGNINLNAVFPLLMQARLLPQLLRNAPSLVVNIGSLSDNGLPMLASYASSKRFGDTASRILSRELVLQGRHADLEVLSVRVGEVTATSYNSHPVSFFEPNAATMAAAALARVGCGRPSVVGYFPHALQQAAMDLAPSWAREKSMLDVIRDRWRQDQEMMAKNA